MLLYSLFKMATVWRTPYAFARLFVGKSPKILNNSTDLDIKRIPGSLSIFNDGKYYSSYAKSPFVERIKEQYQFEVVKDPPEWKYVERLLPLGLVPEITPKNEYPSGYIPPKDEAKNLPYFIKRNRNHDLAFYLKLTYRGQRKISEIKKIEGDVWLMNDDIKDYLKTKNKKYVETRVHELARTIEVKGDFINQLLEWAYSKGF